MSCYSIFYFFIQQKKLKRPRRIRKVKYFINVSKGKYIFSIADDVLIVNEVFLEAELGVTIDIIKIFFFLLKSNDQMNNVWLEYWRPSRAESILSLTVFCPIGRNGNVFVCESISFHLCFLLYIILSTLKFSRSHVF